MELEKRKLSELKENSVNVRRHNQTQIEEFKKSVKKFDVIRPIVVDEDNVILAGHGLATALKELGREEADVLVMRGLSDKDKKKLLLADNKIYSLGNDDYSAIETILKSLAEDKDFDVPGYDSEILEDLYGIRSVEKDAKEAAPYVPEPEAEHESHVEQAVAFAPEAPKRIQEAREEAEQRRFVVCPNCGEKIWL